jgi:hypothetical protein
MRSRGRPGEAGVRFDELSRRPPGDRAPGAIRVAVPIAPGIAPAGPALFPAMAPKSAIFQEFAVFSPDPPESAFIVC